MTRKMLDGIRRRAESTLGGADPVEEHRPAV
jgi:hypothetical protein